MIILGLDSATRTGFGLVKREGGREQVLDHGRLDLRDKDSIADRIESFAHHMTTSHSIDLVAIEDNYLDTTEGKGNVQTVKVLAAITGRWAQAFESRAVKTALVNPQKWATGLLRGLGTITGRDAKKAACARWVLLTYKISPATMDAAEGIAIATFEARQRGFAGRVAMGTGAGG